MNAKKGNKQGQTTLAAKIDRWSGLSNNLEPHLDTLPQLKDLLTELQKVIADAQALRDRQKVLVTDSQDATKQRDQLLAAGDALYSRLRLGLQSVHGPKSVRLKEFGLKPVAGVGRPSKQPPSGTPEVSPPPAPTPAPAAATPPTAAPAAPVPAHPAAGPGK